MTEKNSWAGHERRKDHNRRQITDRRVSDALLFKEVLKLNTKAIGLVFGILCALALFIATNWLVLKGGHISENGEYIVGPNLALLGQFFIGYRVSFLGSIIGSVYAFALGTLCGSMFGWIYNKIVWMRNPGIFYVCMNFFKKVFNRS
jgi:hypothetical protein